MWLNLSTTQTTQKQAAPVQVNPKWMVVTKGFKKGFMDLEKLKGSINSSTCVCLHTKEKIGVVIKPYSC